jgi:threonine dehydrogenase-like Zn-dependent dehydrogenase
MSDTTMEAACRRHDLTEAANLAAVLFALTALFKKANEVGAGHLVIGGGPIGQACLLAARRLGVHALALSDVSPSRRKLCTRLGAEVFDPSEGDLAEAVEGGLGGSPDAGGGCGWNQSYGE